MRMDMRLMRLLDGLAQNGCQLLAKPRCGIAWFQKQALSKDRIEIRQQLICRGMPGRMRIETFDDEPSRRALRDKIGEATPPRN